MKERKISPLEMTRLNKQGHVLMDNEKIIIETSPRTFLNAKDEERLASQVGLLDIESQFCFTCKIEFDFQTPFDQCGIMLKDEKQNKIMHCAIESRNQVVHHLQSVVYHRTGGDISTREIAAQIHRIYFRIWFRKEDVRVQYSFNGDIYQEVRAFRTTEREKVTIVFYACSPNDSYFDCTFSNLSLLERD